MNAAAGLERLAEVRLVAVLRVQRAEQVAPAVGALREGGLEAIELTYTSPDAAAAIEAARSRHGDELLLGAGTLRTKEDVDSAVAAGADFLVSPHLDPDLLAAMLAADRLALPGVLSTSEVASALDVGAGAIKLFPGSLGGPPYLRALRAPFPELRAVPTGGVNLDNIGEWFAAGAVAVGVGGELCRRELIEAGRWGELTELARRYVEAVSEASR